MGGKGRRRREKNYMAAHGGGNTRLPPPPDPSSLDAVPSKLREIMSLAGAARKPINNRDKNSRNSFEGVSQERGNSISGGLKRKRNDDSLTGRVKQGDEVPQVSTDEKKKKKRKKKKPNDMRFMEVDKSDSAGSHRKERRKQRLEARKKKHKMSEEDLDFPGHEHIKFGDVVEAPPKLTTIPKAQKTTPNASQERLRLQAVDAYRKRKAWTSRPGIQLPPSVVTSPP